VRIFRRGRPAPDTNEQLFKDAIELAWRVHGAQEAWTAKVDTKASILFALEGGSLFVILTANSQTGAFHTFGGWPLVLEIIGVAVLFLGTLFSGAAVFPMLGKVSRHRSDHHRHYIYFGHLRHWHHQDLQRKLTLRGGSDEVAMLSLQLIAMSKRNWRKHRLVQVSVLLALLGVTLICAAVAITVTT
jgi:Family of unknown function (DUF5706)